MLLLDPEEQAYLATLQRNQRMGIRGLVMPRGGGDIYDNPMTWGGLGRAVMTGATALAEGFSPQSLSRGMIGAMGGVTIPEGARIIEDDAGGRYFLMPDGSARPIGADDRRHGGLLDLADALPMAGMQGGPRGALGAGAQRMRRGSAAVPEAPTPEVPARVPMERPNSPAPPPASAPRAATMTPDEAMAGAQAALPGARVPLLEGEDLARANELSQRVLDFRRQQMSLPVRERVQARPEDRLFADPDFNQHLPVEQGAASRALDALRIENIAPRQQLPGARAQAGTVADMAANYGAAYDRIANELGPIARIMRGEKVPDATPQQIASARSGAFYNLRPVYDRLVEDGVPPDEAMRRIMQEAQAIAGTSPRTETTENVLNSSFLQNRMARGLPVDAASVQAATGPGSGYGMIYDQHPALTQGLLDGTITLGQNPKPSIFARNIAGDRSAATADVHNVRAVNMLYNDVNPGGLPASAFENAAAYRRYVEAYTPGGNGGPPLGMSDRELREILVARPSGQGVRGQQISTEYPVYNDITAEVGRRIGLSPADVQALMWFHYGPRTGLTSTAHTVPELLQQRLSITAQGLGITPQEALRLYRRNMIPLAGVAPAGLLAAGSDE